MKNYPLSTFQKEQYTQYLQIQLQKFSAFMLSQKKQNQRYNMLENVIEKQNSQITKLSDKIKIVQLFQKQNFRHSQKIQTLPLKANDLDHRLRKVQSIYFQRQIQKQNFSSQRNNEGLKIVKDQLNKKIKNLQKEVKKITIQSQNQQKIKLKQNYQNSPIATNHSEVLSVKNQNFASKFDLKKMQDKLHGFFQKNFNKIQRMIRKSVSKSIKKDQQKSKKSKISEDVFIQEQTFGNSYKYNDYEIDNQNKSNIDKSITISDTSGRLHPVQYYSQKQVQKQQEKRKRNRISRSRSMQKQKQISIKQKSGSRSLSRSKSVKRKNKEKKEYKKLTLKSPLRKSEQKSKSRSRQKLKSIKQYKKSCKKKHF